MFGSSLQGMQIKDVQLWHSQKKTKDRRETKLRWVPSNTHLTMLISSGLEFLLLPPLAYPEMHLGSL